MSRAGPICPMGHAAVRHTRSSKTGAIQLWVKECPSCPLRSRCLAKPKDKVGGDGETEYKYKTISHDARAEPANWIRLHERSKTAEGKARLKERGETGEFCFARLKGRMRFRRLSMWGLRGARTEVGLMALALNLATLAGKLSMEDLQTLLRALIRLFRTSCELYRPSPRLLVSLLATLSGADRNTEFGQLSSGLSRCKETAS